MEKNILNFHFDYLHPSLPLWQTRAYNDRTQFWYVWLAMMSSERRKLTRFDLTNARGEKFTTVEHEDQSLRSRRVQFVFSFFTFDAHPPIMEWKNHFFFQIANCFVNSAIFSASGTHSLILERSHTNLKLIDWLKVNLNSSLDSEWSIHLHW